MVNIQNCYSKNTNESIAMKNRPQSFNNRDDNQRLSLSRKLIMFSIGSENTSTTGDFRLSVTTNQMERPTTGSKLRKTNERTPLMLIGLVVPIMIHSNSVFPRIFRVAPYYFEEHWSCRVNFP